MSDPTRPTIELHDAYVWDCDECGVENWTRAVIVTPESLDAETRAILDEAAGDDWVTGDIVTRPDVVTCRHCGTEYDADDTGDDDLGEF